MLTNLVIKKKIGCRCTSKENVRLIISLVAYYWVEPFPKSTEAPVIIGITTKNLLYNLPLMVNGKSVVVDNGAQLTNDVGLVFPVVPDEHDGKVWSAQDIVGGEWREGIPGSHIHLTDTMHGIYLKKDIYTK